MSQPNKAPLYPSDKASEDTLPTPLYSSKEAYAKARTALLDELAMKYPTHFSNEGQPWALGIREALLAELEPLGHSALLITQALHHFTRSVPYLTNCALSGLSTPRVGLDGQLEGVVTRRELIYVLTQLSGLVRRKDRVQAAAYREWALREMVLGLLHDDVTPEGLVQSRVRKKVVTKAQQLAACSETPSTLKLQHKVTGTLHPAIYAAPYLNDALYQQFKERHPDHVTSRKTKAKRALLFPQDLPAKACKPVEPVEPVEPAMLKAVTMTISRKATDSATNATLQSPSGTNIQVVHKRKRSFSAPQAV
jgi:hypothetical protein